MSQPTHFVHPGQGQAIATRQYLVNQRNAGATPDVITDELIAAGWDADAGARAALQSLRSRDHHRLLYWGLTFSAGFAALAVASAIHVALDAHHHPVALAAWITLALIAIPIVAVTAPVARKVERTDPHAIWSPTRRALFGTLAGITAFIGISRLLTYVFRAVAALVDVPGYDLSAASFVQVAVSLLVSAPLFTWALFEWRRSNVLIRSLSDDDALPGDSTAAPGGQEYGRVR